MFPSSLPRGRGLPSLGQHMGIGSASKRCRKSLRTRTSWCYRGATKR
jgi:hypothetical protein